MQLACELLALCPAEMLDRALEIVEGNQRRAHAASGVGAVNVPAGNKPSLEWFSRLFVERGTNSAYPRVRAVAARVVPLACRELQLGKLFNRQEAAQPDPFSAAHPYTPKVWRMLPLPAPSTETLSALLETREPTSAQAEGGPAAAAPAAGEPRVSPFDSVFETDALYGDGLAAYLGRYPGSMAQCPQRRARQQLSCSAECSLTNPWHALARRALQWAPSRLAANLLRVFFAEP